jgi:hypothetical protein
MSDYAITMETLMAKDGGQAYMESVYPQLYEAFANPKTKVKLREDDDTASGGVFRHKDTGWWMLKDFGAGTATAKTAVQVCMEFEGVEFGQAFKILAGFYGVTLTNTAASATYDSRPAGPEDVPSRVQNLKYKEFSQAEVLTILSKYAWEGIEWGGTHNGGNDKIRMEMALELFKFYRLKCLESYEMVAADGTKVHIYTQNERFPMFAYDEGEFQKIYKPKGDKKYRFMFAGKKPEKYIHGLMQHEGLAIAKELNAASTASSTSATDASAASSASATDASKKVKTEFREDKFPEIILCSGGSDALNVAALGYKVIWMNSESEKLQAKDYSSIRRMTYEFYNLPDIDQPGRAAAKELAHKFLDVKTIWLPASMAEMKDLNDKPLKDVRDFLKTNTKRQFNGLVKTALPFRFWDEQHAYNKDGEQKFKFGRPLVTYELNHVQAYNFLQMNGFYRYASDKTAVGYIFIRIDGNSVRVVEANDIKNFIHEFLAERQLPNDLRNSMFRSQQLNDASLSNLAFFEPNFRYYGADFQYIFFENGAWKVTKEGIEKTKYPAYYVWDSKIIRIKTKDKLGRMVSREAKVLPEKMFEIKADGDAWDIDIKNIDGDFFKFVINSCRIHWRKELETKMEFSLLSEKEQKEYVAANELSAEEIKHLMSFQNVAAQDEYKKRNQFMIDGELLSAEEKAEQKLALVNRIFMIGYMLHLYKDLSKPWAAFLVDYRISDEGASNGRAGKGLMAKALYEMLTHTWVDGRKQDVLAYEHVWEPVKKNFTDMIHIEDWGEYQPFEALYGPLTSSLPVNPKGKEKVVYNFSEYGKFFIDTNFAIRNLDGSSKGRRLLGVFADYYHEDTEFYREFRTPKTEFGTRFFEGWDDVQWNLFYNFMAQCLQFYLSVSEGDVKIDPPQANINKRNYLSIMGENFRGWADNYFSGRLNDLVARTEAFDDCKSAINAKILSPQGFWKKLQAWAEFHGYKFNPEDVKGWKKESEYSKYGSIKLMVDNPARPGNKTQKEYVYIQAKKEETENNNLPF